MVVLRQPIQDQWPWSGEVFGVKDTIDSSNALANGWREATVHALRGTPPVRPLIVNACGPRPAPTFGSKINNDVDHPFRRWTVDLNITKGTSSGGECDTYDGNPP